jgi:hypothetical protein
MSRTPRQQLSTWLREQIAQQKEIDMPALADSAVAHFSADVDFLRDWAADTLRPVAYTLGTQIAADSRVPSVHHAAPAPTGIEAMKPRPTWLTRLEHVNGRYIRLGAMTKQEVSDWAKERRERGTIELHLAGLGDKLAAQMPDDKTVAEVFTDEKIDLWARSLKVQVKVNIPVPQKVRLTTQEAAD